MDNKHTELFANAPVPKAVFGNAIPSIISMVMILIYNLADTFFIGQISFVGPKEKALMVAAVSIASPAFFLFMAVGNLFGVGGTSLISRSLGAGDHSKAKHVSAFCFWTEVIIGVIATICLIAFARPICYTIGASEDTIEYAVEYITILALSVPCMVVGNSFSNIIRSEGNPKVAMFGTILGNVINIILDPIFISGFKMGVLGAAVATVIGNYVSAIFYILHLVSKRSMLSINPKNYAVSNGVCSGVMAIGVPAALNSLLMTFSNIILNSIMKSYDDLAVAGLGVAAKVNSIVVMFILGFGIGVQPLLGFNFGARNKKRYMDCLKFSLLVGFILSCIMTVICYCAADPLVHAFLKDEAAFDFGFKICRIYIYAGPVLGFMFIFQSAIQSTGAAVPALILSVCRQGLILIPLIFVFNYIFADPVKMTLAVPVADYSSTAISVILFIYAFRKYFYKQEKLSRETNE